MNASNNAVPPCSCGTAEFRVHVTMPVVVHVSNEEKTLEVIGASPSDVTHLETTCEGCGSSTRHHSVSDTHQLVLEYVEGQARELIDGLEDRTMIPLDADS